MEDLLQISGPPDPGARLAAGKPVAGAGRGDGGAAERSRVSFPTRSTPTVPSPGTPRTLRHRAIISRWRCGAAGSPSLLQLCFEDGSEGLRPIFFPLMKDLGIKKNHPMNVRNCDKTSFFKKKIMAI